MLSYDNPENEPGSAGPPLKTPSGWESIFLGPHGVRAGWRAAFYVALFALVLFILEFARRLVHSSFLEGLEFSSAGNLFVQELFCAASAIVVAAFMGRVEGRAFGEFGMPWNGVLGGRFWQGIAWGTAQITLLMLLMDALGGYSISGLEHGAAYLVRYALEWAVVFLLVGIFEEFFFRGYLQFTLAQGVGFWAAATLTSLCFGAVHLANPGEGFVGAISVFVIGMFLCLTLRRTGTLWFAIGWHAAFDFGETYLYAVPNSGIVMRGHLLAASIHGPRWITGGSVGPEGSALAFGVVALAFVAFDRVYRGKKAELKS